MESQGDGFTGGFHEDSRRKRPHISLEYEGEPVRVKQEFPDPHTSCYYGGGPPPPHGGYSSCSVKTEPGSMNGSFTSGLQHPSFLTPPPPPPTAPSSTCWYSPTIGHSTPLALHVSPYHTSFSTTSVKSDPTQLYNNGAGAVSHYPGPYTSVYTNTPSFSPWGLAAPSPVGGATFGSLAGVDMSSSLEEGGGSPCHNEEGAGRKRKSPRGLSRLKQELAEDDGWEPPLWRQQMENISKMREKRDAPVDLMGAHKNAEQTTSVSPQVRRYQVLVSLMLSSQTKDQITSQAMTALKRHGLTIENILSTPEEQIAQIIHPVGFWRKKAGYIKRVSQILLDEYGGDIPATMDQLCALPGVGPKMSHLVMDIAWDRSSGVAVDTHVHRISHRLGWMRRPTDNPEVTRVCIEKWLPKSEWRELNWLLVGFGQQRCLPIGPKCKGCLNEDICPSSKLKDGGPWGRKKRPVKRELIEPPVKTEHTSTS